MIKLLIGTLASIALLTTALLSAPAVTAQEPVDVCANIPGVQLVPPANFHTIQVRYPETGFRSECVRIEATATPVPATPVVVTNTILIQCEGPYDPRAPYASFTNVGYGLYGGFNVTNLAVYPYAAGYNWIVPTLVTRTNGTITNAIPNAPQCLPVAATPTPVPAAAATPTVIYVTQPAAAAPVSQPSVIRAPNTGDGGLAGNPHCNGNSDNVHLPNHHTSQDFPAC